MNRDAWDFTLLIVILSPIIYFTSTITVWRSRHATDEIVCAEDPSEQCYSYDNWDIFKFNYLWWTTWFFFGLHFSYTDSPAFGGVLSFSFAFDEMADWTITHWIVTAGIGVAGLVVGILIIIKAAAIGMIRWYTLQFLVVVALFGFIIFMFPNRTTHLHHWSTSLIILLFLGSPDMLTAGIHGFMNALVVEGGAFWGYDGVWRFPNTRLLLRQGLEVRGAKIEEIGKEEEADIAQGNILVIL